MLDLAVFVMEASTANILIYREGTGLISPPREAILPGISVAMLEMLARQIGIPFLHQPLRVDDVLAAEPHAEGIPTDELPQGLLGWCLSSTESPREQTLLGLRYPSQFSHSLFQGTPSGFPFGRIFENSLRSFS